MQGFGGSAGLPYADVSVIESDSGSAATILRLHNGEAVQTLPYPLAVLAELRSRVEVLVVQRTLVLRIELLHTATCAVRVVDIRGFLHKPAQAGPHRQPGGHKHLDNVTAWLGA